MKKLAVLVLAVGLAVGGLAPGLAFAGASTDAALGLGAFAVFNQIISGTGIFGLGRPAAVVAAPPAPVVVAPPVQQHVIVEERHYYVPAPVYYAPPPPVYYVPSRVVVVREGWCPPGQAKKGRCGGWAYYRYGY